MVKKIINLHYIMVGVAVALVISAMHEKACKVLDNAQRFGKFNHSYEYWGRWHRFGKTYLICSITPF